MKDTELDKLPYYENRPADGRQAVLIPFMTDGGLRLPFPGADEILILKPESGHRMYYMAKEPACPDIDFHLPLFELFVQHIASTDLHRFVRGLVVDVMNFGAILEMYELILRDNRGNVTSDLLMATQLEYLFYNVRSLYDQLQRLIKTVWDITDVRTGNKRALPESFRKVAFAGQDHKIRTADEITARYGLPTQISRFYEQQARFFNLCKAIRDDMAHHGKSFSDKPIFVLDTGFAVDVTMYPYSQFSCWRPDLLKNNKLGSVRALIAHIAQKCIELTSEYANALKASVRLPVAIGPSWHVYVRCRYADHLHRLDAYIEHPWIEAPGTS